MLASIPKIARSVPGFVPPPASTSGTCISTVADPDLRQLRDIHGRSLPARARVAAGVPGRVPSQLALAPAAGRAAVARTATAVVGW